MVFYVRQRGVDLFVDENGAPHLADGQQIVPLTQGAYDYLRNVMWQEEGKTSSRDALGEVVGTLAAFARYEGKVRELHTRAAFQGGALYYELAPGRVVEVDRDGWRIIDDPPVYFRRYPNLKPLPDRWLVGR